MNELESEAGLPATVNYRYADQVGDELFVAGQVPHDHDRVIVGDGDAAAQATQCLDNLRRLVELHHFELGNVRRLTIYVVGEQANLATAWEAVTEWFGGEVPPATLLGVHLLGHPGQLVEVDATVRRPAAGADSV